MASDDVLTEGEIDALMESVDDAAGAADSADDGEYRRFDFAAREQSLLREFKALRPLLERQSEILSATLETTFSIEFSVRSDAPVLLSVADTLAALEHSVAVSTSSLSPLAGPVFAIAPASLLSYTVNAYFGGGGHGAPADTSRSHLTPTELRLAERYAEIQLKSLTQAWADKLALEAGELSTLSVPDRLEMLPASDVLLRLAFSLSAGEFESSIQLLLPFASLEPYRERFAPPRKKEAADSGTSWEPFFRRELPGIELELAAVLATRPIALADLVQLEAGAVIPLPAPELVSLKVEDVLLGEGRFGTFEGFKAVQLQRLASLLCAGD